MDQDIENQLSRIEEKLEAIMVLKAYSMALETAQEKARGRWKTVEMDEVKGYVRQILEIVPTLSE